jgi:hypothetical protein
LKLHYLSLLSLCDYCITTWEDNIKINSTKIGHEDIHVDLLFKSLGILTLPSQYILSLMRFVSQNIEMFVSNSSVHVFNTRN